MEVNAIWIAQKESTKELLNALIVLRDVLFAQVNIIVAHARLIIICMLDHAGKIALLEHFRKTKSAIIVSYHAKHVQVQQIIVLLVSRLKFISMDSAWMNALMEHFLEMEIAYFVHLHA